MNKEWRDTWKKYSLIHCLYYLLKEKPPHYLSIFIFSTLSFILGIIFISLISFNVIETTSQYIIVGLIMFYLEFHTFDYGIYMLYIFSGIVKVDDI